MNCNYTYTDKEQITDLLMSEKYLTACYNGYLLEAATPEVIGCLKELLNNTHATQEQLFGEMNSRGWYPVTKAEDQKLNQTKMKYGAAVSQ